MSGAELTALIASAVAVGTLVREWLKDRNATDRDARVDAAEWYRRWKEAEDARIAERVEFEQREMRFLADLIEREKRWERKCSELSAQLDILTAEIERLKNR